MSRAGLAEAVRAAVTSSQAVDDVAEMTRSSAAVVRMFGAVAGVAYRPDPVETARREASTLRSITDLSLLNALMDLPVDAPIAARELPDRGRALLQRAPRGAVECVGDHFVRRAVAPLSVRFAVVRARHWQEGLVKAGRFAPFCARVMLLPTPPADLDDARMQASFFGIGIWVFTARNLQVLVDPEPYVRLRHTPAQWWFAEEIFQQVSEFATG